MQDIQASLLPTGGITGAPRSEVSTSGRYSGESRGRGGWWGCRFRGHGTNKIEKWYLVGQFGQGGAVTLRFSQFSVIISRKAMLDSSERDLVGFTILKYLEPKGNERFGSYSYLVGPDNLPFSIPAGEVE